MDNFRCAFEDYSKSSCRYPKFHTLLHYYDFIQEYGVPSLCYTGWWEKSHIFLVKRPYLRTGGRKEALYEKLIMRVVLSDRVRRIRFILSEASQHQQQQGAVLHEQVGGKRRGNWLDASAQAKDGIVEDISRGFDNDGYLTIESE